MSICSVGARLIAEALLTQMSMPPKVCAHWRTAAATLRLIAHVHDQRQCPAAGALDLLGGAVDGAGELGMRRGGLGGDRDVGAVACGAQRDREPDAAAGPGDEECLAGKTHGASAGAGVRWVPEVYVIGTPGRSGHRAFLRRPPTRHARVAVLASAAIIREGRHARALGRVGRCRRGCRGRRRRAGSGAGLQQGRDQDLGARPEPLPADGCRRQHRRRRGRRGRAAGR